MSPSVPLGVSVCHSGLCFRSLVPLSSLRPSRDPGPGNGTGTPPPTSSEVGVSRWSAGVLRPQPIPRSPGKETPVYTPTQDEPGHSWEPDGRDGTVRDGRKDHGVPRPTPLVPFLSVQGEDRVSENLSTPLQTSTGPLPYPVRVTPLVG